MKVTFFLGEFPVQSETFIINQINGLIGLGLEVDILALRRGSSKALEAKELLKHDLLAKTRYLITEKNQDSKIYCIFQRGYSIIKCLLTKRIIHSLNFKKFGKMSKSLLLPSVTASIKSSIKTDVIVAHFGVVGVIAKHLKTLGLLDGKLMTVFHGADISVKDVLNNFQNEYAQLFIKGDVMLPISELWKIRLIEMGCPAHKIYINRMGINLDDFSSRDLKKPLNLPLSIITVARFVEKKGLFDAVSAMYLLKQRGVEFNYKIVGGGELEEKLKEHINNLNLESDIELTGFQSQETVKNYLNEADVFLLPSITAKNGDMEGIPVALMEAMAMGIIVVSTVHSGIPELIKDGCSGFLASESSPEQLCDILAKIINDDKIDIAQVRANALNTIAEEFNQKSLYKDLKEIATSVYEH